MPGPCFESQTREKIKIPVAVAKAFMNEALEGIKGGNSYTDSLKSMSEKSGLQPETINSILRRDPQVFSRTKQAIAKSGDTRKIRDAAEGFAAQLKGDATLQHEPGKIAKAWDIQRKLALTGHSPVFPWTHVPDWAVQIPTEGGRARMNAFWQAATDVWRYRGEKGQALYEMDMGLMQAGDRYDAWKSASADIEPGKRSPGDILLQDKKPSWQNRNFDALKPLRYTALEDAWSRVDPAFKEGDTGKAVMAMIARDMNYATGSVKTPIGEAATEGAKTAAQLSNLAGRYNLLLATKLFFAKHMNAVFGPLEYVAKLGRATPAEAAARNIAMGRWANIVTTQLGILGANYAFNKMMGFKTPNLTNPGEASTFLRLRAGNFIIPFSPMLEVLRLPIVFTYAMANKGTDSAGSVAWKTLWNAAHPAAHTLAEQVTGKDFMGKPVPSVRNLIKPVKGYEKPNTVAGAAKQVGEYASTRFSPIAISGGLREFYQALKDAGVSGSMSTAFIKGAVAAALSGGIGKHIFEQQEKKPKGGKQPKVGVSSLAR
jgi:hypothetical protein